MKKVWRVLLWHLFCLVLAGLLLAWDLRFFLFYAFTILLLILRQLERLNATARVFQFANEINLMTMMRHGCPVPEEDNVLMPSNDNWDALKEAFDLVGPLHRKEPMTKVQIDDLLKALEESLAKKREQGEGR